MSGDFAATLAVDIGETPPGNRPIPKPAERVDIQVAHNCAMVTDPPGADVHLLLRADVGKHLPTPRWATILVADSPNWRNLGQIPLLVQRAILASEDAGFYRHQGFEPLFIRQALAENLIAGRVRRGASTVSQQLVKNLYLDGSRSLSRKLEELVLTWRLEQVVPKARIFELYLNLIELGPSIHGVAEGAMRYFGKRLDQLSPLDAVQLALVLPGPRSAWQRLHSQPLDPAWWADWRQKALDLLSVLRRSGALSPEAYRTAKLDIEAGRTGVVAEPP